MTLQDDVVRTEVHRVGGDGCCSTFHDIKQLEAQLSIEFIDPGNERTCMSLAHVVFQSPRRTVFNHIQDCVASRSRWIEDPLCSMSSSINTN